MWLVTWFLGFDFLQFQISEAFKKFGISDSDSAVLIALIHTEEDSHNIDVICAKVDGQQIPVEHLAIISDIPKVKKVNLLECIFP